MRTLAGLLVTATLLAQVNQQAARLDELLNLRR